MDLGENPFETGITISTISLVYIMAVCENRKEIRRNPLIGTFWTGIWGTVYMVGAAFTMEFFPGPIKIVVPVALCAWIVKNAIESVP